MQIALDFDASGHSIRSCGPGQVTVILPRGSREEGPEVMDAVGPDASRVRQEILRRSVVVTPGALWRDWPPQRFEELRAEHLAALLRLEPRPEVVLLGCGGRLRWPAPEVLAPLVEAGVGHELMDTPAACRTYNILMADGRRVAAALLMVEERGPRS